MANTLVSAMITSCNYDLAIPSTNTDRDNEFIEYLNRFNLHVLVPLLIRQNSSYGWVEWNTTETVANIRKVSCPSKFVKFETLYLMRTEHSGTATSGSSTSVVLDSDASSDDDAYNSYYLRTTGGTGDGQEFVITDYDGDTLTATVTPTITTEFSTDTTFAIYKPPTENDRLKQIALHKLLDGYTTLGEPSVFSIVAPSLDTSYMYLGVIPNDVYVLHGWYYAYPTKLTATTHYMPYDPVFDEFARQYATFMALNRDEYNTEVEKSVIQMLQDNLLDIILGHGDVDGGSIPFAGAGD